MEGRVIWAGNGKLAQPEYTGLNMQQKAPMLHRNNLLEGNKMLKVLKGLNMTIKIRKLSSAIKTMDIWNFSDGSINIVSGIDYGQTGEVFDIKVTYENGKTII